MPSVPRLTIGLCLLLSVSLCAAGAAPPRPDRRPPHPAEGLFVELVSEAGLRRTVKDLVAFGNRLGGSTSGDRAAEYVRAAFADAGLSVETVDDRPSKPVRDALKGAGRPRTVIALLPGSHPTRYLLVSAHGDSDSGGPGADDNASGVAVAIEVAKSLAALVRDGRIAVPAVSIRFAVWGTEYWSSQAFVEREGHRLRECAAVLNIDQAGTGAEREAVYFEGNDVPWNRELLRTLEQIGRDYLKQPGFWPEFATVPSQGDTDAYTFLPKRYHGDGLTPLQIAATTIFTAAWDETTILPQTPGWEAEGQPDPSRVIVDYSRHYHRPTDTPENTTEREPQNMVRVSKALGIALLRLAQ